MSLKIRYYDVPVGAQQAMIAQGIGQPFSRGEDLLSVKEDKPYATLERGVWKLDGTGKLLPEAPGGFWWSREISDENGTFLAPPVLEVVFPKPYTATGFTYTFWPTQNQWCSQMEVTWFKRNAILSQSVVYPDKPRWTQNQTVEGFDRIRIKLLKTSGPFQFAKIQMLEIGRVLQFQRSQVEAVSLLNEEDPFLSTLSADTMSVKLCLKDEQGLLPQENQRLELYKNERLLAIQYITGSNRHSICRYTIHSQSAVGLLEDLFLGGFYREVPLSELVAQVLPDWSVFLHPSLENKTVSGYLGVCSRREAIQQIAFAVGAVVKTQGCEGFQILPQSQIVRDKIWDDRIFTGAQMETLQRYAGINLAVHSYGADSERKTLMEEESLFGKGILITFTQPHHSYEIHGGQLTESGPNYVRITAAGPVTLTAKGYSHTQTLHSWRDAEAAGTELRNILLVDKATLVTEDNVDVVLQRLREATQKRQKLRLRVVVDGQQVGDTVCVPNPWGTRTQGFIASMDSVLTDRGHTAELLIYGKEAPMEIAKIYSGDYFAGEEVLYG